jgi:hypothetical protein
LAVEPLTPTEIGERAERLARLSGYPLNLRTFNASTTGSHLHSMRDKPGRGFVEKTDDGRWRLSARARKRIASGKPTEP